MNTTHLAAALLALSASLAHAQTAFEVSADGRQLITLTQDQPQNHRGIGVPFALTPDQQVDLRRQIGGLKIADIDGDGNNDLVAVCYFSNSFPAYEDWHDMIFFGTGSGINTTPGWISTIETHTGDVQIGDLNNDHFPDIVTIHGGIRRDSVRVYFNTGFGMPTTAGYISNTTRSGWGTSGVLADMDQDGDLDLVTTNQGVSPDPFRPVLMFDNTGTTLTTTSVWQSSDDSIQNGIDARDITGDGYPDLAVAKWVNFNSGIYYNTSGTPNPVQALTVPTDDTDKGAAFCDLNNDGIAEVGFGGDPSRIYDIDMGTLTQTYASNPPFSGPQEIALIDADGDGDEDFSEIHFSDGRAHIYLNRDGTLDTNPT
ncbi:MAG: FG-GAP repeat domain-containing protein, partial [Phycisphaerales bacterium]